MATMNASRLREPLADGDDLRDLLGVLADDARRDSELPATHSHSSGEFVG